MLILYVYVLMWSSVVSKRGHVVHVGHFLEGPVPHCLRRGCYSYVSADCIKTECILLRVEC